MSILEGMARVLEHRTAILEWTVILENLIFIRTFKRILEHLRLY